MKIIKVKYKLFLLGFPGLNKFEIDGFKLKSINVEEFLNTEMKNDLSYSTFFLSMATLIDKNNERVMYYLENENYIEYSVSNDCISNKAKLKLIISKYKDIVDFPQMLLKKMRFVFNIPITIPINHIDFYSEDEKYINKYIFYNGCTFWNRLTYIDKEEFLNNTRFQFDYHSYLNELKSERIRRAMDFFNESFESNLISIRFLMLISCLECLFNYKRSSSTSITFVVSSISAKILTAFNEEYDEYYDLFKKFYDKRSKFVHGNTHSITIEDEKKLRKLTRRILIFYLIVNKTNGFTINETINYLKEPMKYSIIDKIFLTAILSNSLKEQQLGVLKILEDNKVEINEDLKKSLLNY